MLDDYDYPSPAELSPAEVIAYRMIYAAAEAGEVCPSGMDLEDAAGFNSTSMGPKLVNRLEAKGLIIVERFANRYRRVKIVATDKWTAYHPNQKVFTPHVPRGMRSRPPVPTDRKPYKSRGV